MRACLPADVRACACVCARARVCVCVRVSVRACVHMRVGAVGADLPACRRACVCMCVCARARVSVCLRSVHVCQQHRTYIYGSPGARILNTDF